MPPVYGKQFFMLDGFVNADPTRKYTALFCLDILTLCQLFTQGRKIIWMFLRGLAVIQSPL